MTPVPSYQLPLLNVHPITVDSLQNLAGQGHLSSLQAQSLFWMALRVLSITQSWVNLLATQKHGIATVENHNRLKYLDQAILNSMMKQKNQLQCLLFFPHFLWIVLENAKWRLLSGYYKIQIKFCNNVCQNIRKKHSQGQFWIGKISLQRSYSFGVNFHSLTTTYLPF